VSSEARWNLISRNGQDVVSGIYIFTVQSDAGTQRGKFDSIQQTTQGPDRCSPDHR